MRLNLKKPKISSKKVIQLAKSTLLVVFTAYLIVGTFIALPQVDEYLGSEKYDLLLKEDQYWKKNFILELQVDKDDKKATLQMEETKNIIHRRLNSYGVEEVKILETDYTVPTPEPETSTDEIVVEGVEEASEPTIAEEAPDYNLRYLRVTVQSSTDPEATEALISLRNFFRFYTPKPDVDFNNTEDQIAPYIRDNYDRTDFTRHSFRNVLVKKLPTQDESQAYFAIFKPWPHTSKGFNDMMEENAGYIVGIEFDGIISPQRVSSEFFLERVTSASNGTQSTNVRPEFSIAIGEDEATAEVFELLYNSGVIPVTLSLVDSEELVAETSEINHKEVFLSLVVGIAAVFIYLFARDRSKVERNIVLMISVLTVGISWIAYLKFFQVEIDLPVLLYQLIGMVFINFILTQKDSNNVKADLLVLAVTACAALFSDGYGKLFANGVFFMSLGSVIIIPLARIYKDKMYRLIVK